jgi:hypothetical protein
LSDSRFGYRFGDVRVGAQDPPKRSAATGTRNRPGDTPAPGEIVTADGPATGGAATPAPATAPPSGPAAAPAAPEQKCTVVSGPSYSPSGTIPLKTTSSGGKEADFSFSAEFGEAHGALERLGLGIRTGASTGAGIGAYFLGVGALPGLLLGGLIGGIAGLAGSDSAPGCCEVRQFIKWDRRFYAYNGNKPPHSGFPSSTGPDTWIEDRDTSDGRYGHRSGPHSAPGGGCFDEYKTGAVQNMATGNSYCGSDGPAGPSDMVGKYQFQLKVVDTHHGEAVKATSSVITVNWG